MAKNIDVQAASIRDIEREDSSSVWIINNTNPRGIINISVPDGVGGSTTAMIPVTWVPVDITTQVSKADILKLPRFRNLISQGSIVLIKEDEALRVLSTEGAKEEAKKVYSIQKRDVSLQGTAAGLIIDNQQDMEAGSTSGFAINIAHNNDLEEEQIINMLKGQQGVLTANDYRYIAKNSEHARVKEFCATQII